jgi:hypothetical protein
MTVHSEALARLIAGVDRPVLQNAIRSMYVEHQIAVLLGDEWAHVGTDWGGWDFESPAGLRLEVKQASAKQSWKQSRKSKGVFDIARRTGRYEGATWVAGEGRFADVYVFAWHGGWDEPELDQRDETQWEYYVVATSDLPQQKTIALSGVCRLATATSSRNLLVEVRTVSQQVRTTLSSS